MIRRKPIPEKSPTKIKKKRKRKKEFIVPRRRRLKTDSPEPQRMGTCSCCKKKRIGPGLRFLCIECFRIAYSDPSDNYKYHSSSKRQNDK